MREDLSTMNCPECGCPVHTREREGVEIDECARCGGIWFDNGELALLTQDGNEAFALSHSDLSDEAHQCPRDGNLLMESHIDGTPVELGPSCGGLWLCALCIGALLGIQLEGTPATNIRCAGCGHDVPVANTILRFGSRWCEACVVAGEYPGANNTNVEAMRTEMAKEMAKSTERIARGRLNAERNQEIAQLNRRGSMSQNAKFFGWLQRYLNR